MSTTAAGVFQVAFNEHSSVNYNICDTISYFDVRSKADTISLIYCTEPKTKSRKRES